MKEHLESRLAYFFRSRRRWRGEVHELVRQLQELGPVIVIGGMVRDLALRSNLEFTSDVDLVVDPGKLDRFHAFVCSKGGKRNRFGGYSWSSAHWRIDLWALEDTWAHQAGHVQVAEFRDLLKVTFFDCDAVLYDLQRRRVLSKSGFFENLHEGVLEINLHPNPYPLGNVVRALRYATINNFRWGPKLARFMAQQIGKCDWQGVLDRERKAFGTGYIEGVDRKSIGIELRTYLEEDRKNVLDIRKYCGTTQYTFDFRGSVCGKQYRVGSDRKDRSETTRQGQRSIV